MNEGDVVFRAESYGGENPLTFVNEVTVVQDLGEHGVLCDIGKGKTSLISRDSIFATRQEAHDHLKVSLSVHLANALVTVSDKYKARLERLNA